MCTFSTAAKLCAPRIVSSRFACIVAVFRLIRGDSRADFEDTRGRAARIGARGLRDTRRVRCEHTGEGTAEAARDDR
jgi:hypothetical protein